MDTKQVTTEVRLQHWAQIIRERQASGMGIDEWCKMRGIKRNQYFYYQRKLREMACEQLEIAAEKGLAISGFAQVQLSEPAMPPEQAPIAAGQLRIEIGGIAVVADSSYPPETLAALLRELQAKC